MSHLFLSQFKSGWVSDWMESNMAMRIPSKSLVNSQVIPLAHLSGSDWQAATIPQTQWKQDRRRHTSSSLRLTSSLVLIFWLVPSANCGHRAESDLRNHIPSRSHLLRMPALFCSVLFSRPHTTGPGVGMCGRGMGGAWAGERDHIVERSEAVSPRGHGNLEQRRRDSWPCWGETEPVLREDPADAAANIHGSTFLNQIYLQQILWASPTYFRLFSKHWNKILAYVILKSG